MFSSQKNNKNKEDGMKLGGDGHIDGIESSNGFTGVCFSLNSSSSIH